jgi:type IV pilus secretin PilQ/predicted competence protein
MKAKILLISVVLIFVALTHAVAPLYANVNNVNNINPNIIIKDIEYLTGDDFVQLYFKIDRMIPIPDVFYPDKSNNFLIVMRMNDAAFEVPKNLFTFQSSVIDHVKVTGGKNQPYVDVEIHLKEQVNYRVFTNRKGLYIEFPNIKNESPSTLTSPSSSPSASSEPTPSVPASAITTAAADTNKDINTDINSTKTVIKDIAISEKSPHRIKFKVIMTGQPDFEVIPIPDEPARLAIDFKNTRCKRLNKPINLLNVKMVRGAYNSTSVYRMVFDLHYLKNYKVSPQNGNILEVEFFDNTVTDSYSYSPPNPSPTPANPTENAEPGASTPGNDKKEITEVGADEREIARETGGNGGFENNGAKGSSSPAAVEPGGTTGAAGTTGTTGTGGTGGTGGAAPVESNKRNITITNIDDEGGTSGNLRINTDDNSITISNEDFFEDEKSQVTIKDAAAENEKAGSLEQSGKSQMQFVKKTIDEGEKLYIGERMSFNFHNADLKDVIKIIAKLSDKNIVLDPGISGRVTSQLKDVPWDQALDLFLKINQLDYVEEGNILRIGRVDQLAQEAEQRRKLRDARQMEGELSVITRTLSFSKVADVAPLLKKQLSRRGEILQDARSNTLIISEVPSRIEVLDKLIDTLDVANPQVSIEARVVETRTNFVQSLGIQWGYNFIADAAYGNQTTLKFPNSVSGQGNQFTSTASPLVGPLGGYAVNLPANGATSGTVFSIGNVVDTLRLDFALSAMESKGNARIISAPKTTTQNNQQASIMQGRMIPVQIIQNNTVTIQYRPAALELKVTPQITAEGTVIAALEIDNNSADFANLVNGIPPIITQSIKTTVMVDDGGTIVIGGLYKIEKSTTKDGVPFFSKIPILGNLFRSSNDRSEQREILIFITPRIIK